MNKKIIKLTSKRYPMSKVSPMSIAPKKKVTPKFRQYGDRGYKPSSGVGVGY